MTAAVLTRPKPACVGEPHDWHSDVPAEQEACKVICGRCPLAVSCLAGARARGEQWGVWGGVSLNPVDEVTAALTGEPAAFVRPSVYAPRHGENRFYERCTAGVDGRACGDCRAAHAEHVARGRAAHSPAPVASVLVDLPPLALFDEIGPDTHRRRISA